MKIKFNEIIFGLSDRKLAGLYSLSCFFLTGAKPGKIFWALVVFSKFSWVFVKFPAVFMVFQVGAFKMDETVGNREGLSTFPFHDRLSQQPSMPDPANNFQSCGWENGWSAINNWSQLSRVSQTLTPQTNVFISDSFYV